MALIRFELSSDDSQFIELNVTIAYTTPPIKNRDNQDSIKILDGSIFTVDKGNTTCNGTLLLKALSPDEWYKIEGFIEDTCNFNEYNFNIRINSEPSLDLGNGRGIDAFNCSFSEAYTSTKGLAIRRAPDIYHVTFPYYFSKGA